MKMTEKLFKWFFLVAIFLVVMPAQSEIRDPTRPSGFIQDGQTGDGRLESPGSLDLQAIFYHPENPGALINGRHFAVGDQIADAKIKAIHADRVVLISAEGEKEVWLVMPSVKSAHEITRMKSVEGMK